ncbi:MAG: hypothetical protein TU36_007540 [Vulcanisaeta sp. AZ3]
MRLRGLNVSRRKDPEGNYVVTMDLETYDKLKDSIIRLGLISESLGNVIIVRSYAWNRVRKLVNVARELGINVHSD